MKIIFGVLFLITFVVAENDTAFECLSNAFQQTPRNLCPEIPQIDDSGQNQNSDIKVVTRLSVTCYKGQYLNGGCNETEWIRVCNKRVDNLKAESYSNETMELMRKFCNEDEEDPAFECFQNSLRKMKNTSSCPEVILYTNSYIGQNNYDKKKLTRMAIACYKGQYLTHGCNETEWIRVCRKRADKLDAQINGEETIKLMLKYCDEEEGDVAFNCFQTAVNQMTNTSCPEVIYATNQNDTKEEVAKQQAACYKRYYLNHKCDIAQWKRICHVMVNKASFEMNGRDALHFARKYCDV